jgi:hypothetical protein
MWKINWEDFFNIPQIQKYAFHSGIWDLIKNEFGIYSFIYWLTKALSLCYFLGLLP